MPNQILVTGAAGFVGAHLLPALATAFLASSIVPSDFDVTDQAAMLAAIQANPPDACVHLAAIAAIPAAQQDPDAAWRVNLDGTLGLPRALLSAAPHCTLLFPSTADAMAAASGQAPR